MDENRLRLHAAAVLLRLFGRRYAPWGYPGSWRHLHRYTGGLWQFSDPGRRRQRRPINHFDRKNACWNYSANINIPENNEYASREVIIEYGSAENWTEVARLSQAFYPAYITRGRLQYNQCVETCGSAERIIPNTDGLRWNDPTDLKHKGVAMLWHPSVGGKHCFSLINSEYSTWTYTTADAYRFRDGYCRCVGE